MLDHPHHFENIDGGARAGGQRKESGDSRCERPHDCAAKGSGLCRRCHFVSQQRINAASQETRERQKAAWADPEKRAAESERQKAAWADPEKRAARIKRQKAAWADPEKRAAESERQKAAWADPEKRAAHAKRQKAAWADPEKRAARDCLHNDELSKIADAVATTCKTYEEIADDWLITSGRVGQIAKQFGVQRRSRKLDS